MRQPNPPPPRAQKHRRTRRPSVTALDLRAVPSPRPSSSRQPETAAPERSAVAPAGTSRVVRLSSGRSGDAPGVDWERVEELASKGLTLEQIAVEMDWPGLPPPPLRARMEAAIKRGRARGSAQLKRKHYDAAMNGSVSAQKDMLALLEEQEFDEDAEPPDVVRVILGGQQEETAEREGGD